MRTPFPVLVDLLRAAARLGASRSVLAEVMILAGQAPGLNDVQLRVRLVELAGDRPPGVLRAHRGAVLSPVAARFSDRPRGSLVCPLCVERTTGSGPISGWPPVELPPTPVAPGGQPDPPPAEARRTVSVPGPVFLELLCVRVQLGVYNAVLADVLALPATAPALGDEQLWAALVVLGERAERLLLEGEIR
jgi:hypothetical protein